MAKPKHILLAAILLALFTGCACDPNYTTVKTPSNSYIVKKGSITHKDNGCISFPYQEYTDENSPTTTIEVCGSYTIEN